MGLSGKLLGAGIGFFLGGPLGAVVGGLLGHYVKDAPLPGMGLEPDDPAVFQQQQELRFVASLVGLLTAMVSADGDVDEAEVRTLRRFFSERLGYRGESLEIVRGLFKEFLRVGVDVEALCRDLSLRADEATRLLLVQCLWDVARADGRVHPAEEVLIRRVAALLGVAPQGFRSFGGAAAQQRRGDYDVLGVAPTAAPEEIKAAYRDLVKKYHPDRVAHLGEEFRGLAHEKFLEVQEAYERVRAAHGL